MAALFDRSSDGSVGSGGEVESLLFRLPLELRQQIYADVFGTQRLIYLDDFGVELGPETRSMIYRPKSEKLREDDVLKASFVKITEYLKRTPKKSSFLERRSTVNLKRSNLRGTIWKVKKRSRIPKRNITRNTAAVSGQNPCMSGGLAYLKYRKL